MWILDAVFERPLASTKVIDTHTLTKSNLKLRLVNFSIVRPMLQLLLLQLHQYGKIFGDLVCETPASISPSIFQISPRFCYRCQESLFHEPPVILDSKNYDIQTVLLKKSSLKCSLTIADLASWSINCSQIKWHHYLINSSNKP